MIVRLACTILLLIFFLGRLWAQPETENELIFPIVVNGFLEDSLQFQTVFRFFNLSATRASVTVLGTPDKPEAGRILFCLPPINIPTPPFDPTLGQFFFLSENGAMNVVSSGESEALFAGWARVLSSISKDMTASAEISLIRGSPQPCLNEDFDLERRIDPATRPSTEIVTSVQVPGISPARKFRAPVIINRNRHTAFAIVNPSKGPALLQLELRDTSGQSKGIIEEYFLAAESRVSQFTWEYFDQCDPGHSICITALPDPIPPPEFFHGTLEITSDIPIAVGAIDVLFPGGEFVNVPVSALTE